jgi:hypothetical protein
MTRVAAFAANQRFALLGTSLGRSVPHHSWNARWLKMRIFRKPLKLSGFKPHRWGSNCQRRGSDCHRRGSKPQRWGSASPASGLKPPSPGFGLPASGMEMPDGGVSELERRGSASPSSGKKAPWPGFRAPWSWRKSAIQSGTLAALSPLRNSPALHLVTGDLWLVTGPPVSRTAHASRIPFTFH